jgi:hypothetical protein
LLCKGRILGRNKKIYLEKMAEGKQQPFNKLLQPWPVKPFFKIKRLTVDDGILYMLLQLLDDHLFTANKNDFMHIPEGPVIKIRRSDNEYFIIDEHGFGMKVRRKVIAKLQSSPVQRAKIAVTEDINQHHVGMPGDNHSHFYTSLTGIHQRFPQKITGQEIWCFDQDLPVGILYKLHEFFIYPFFCNRRHIPDNFIVIMPNCSDVRIFLKNILVINLKIKVEDFFERNRQFTLQAKHQFSPRQSVNGNIGRAYPADHIIDNKYLSMITAVIFSEEIDNKLDLGEKAHLAAKIDQQRQFPRSQSKA